MKRSWTIELQRVGLIFALALITTVLAGCRCDDPVEEAPPECKKEVKAEAPAEAPAPEEPQDPRIVSQKFLSDNDSASMVLLKSDSPLEVMLNKNFPYNLELSNLTNLPMEKVTVTQTFPPNLTLVSSDPKARKIGSNTYVWDLGNLKGKEVKTIKAVLRASKAGVLKHCVRVNYVPKMCRKVTVVAPELQIAKTMPKEVLKCDNIPIKVTVKNTGTGNLNNVVVSDQLPDGLVTENGQRSFSVKIPTLAGNEAKDITVNLKATRTGSFTNVVTAQSEHGYKANARAQVMVKQPVLKIDQMGTRTQFIGRNVTYSFKVANRGNGDAKNLLVTATLPQGTKFIKASNEATFKDGKVYWQVAVLPPGKALAADIVLQTMAAGKLQNIVSAKAYCAEAQQSAAQTVVKGIPAILLEVVDTKDPVAVGEQETYIVTVTNQGSAPATNVKIVCHMEDAQKYVSSAGVTKGSPAADMRKVTFAPLPSLAPRQKAQWQVIVKAQKAGDVRFKVEMTSDQLKRPVNETEATHQY